MADNINTILVDNTSISKIMCLSRSNYLSMSANIDPYYDSTLFLVNDGTNKTTDIYLGANRFTDIIVQDVPPNSTDTPGKFYLVPVGKVTGYSQITESLNVDNLNYDAENYVIGNITSWDQDSVGKTIDCICTCRESGSLVETSLTLSLNFSSVVHLEEGIYKVKLPKTIVDEGKIYEVVTNGYTQVNAVFVKYELDDTIVEGYDIWYVQSDNNNPSVTYPVKVMSHNNSNLVKSIVVNDSTGSVEFSFDQVELIGSETYLGTRTVSVPMLNSQGELPESILLNIANQVKRYARPTWQPITPRQIPSV